MSPKLKKAAIVIVVVLAVVLLVTGGTKFYENYSIKHTASSFISKILAGDGSGSYQDFDKTGQAATDPDIWKEEVSQWSDFFKGYQPVYLQTIKNKNYTFVDYNIQGQDGEYLFDVTLVKSGLGQKVEAFGSSLQ